jgi:hypothetical protein
MAEALGRLGEGELMALLREGLRGGADTVYFRAGCAPLAAGHGFASKLSFRQLAAEDVEAVAAALLLRCHVPERAAVDPADVAHALAVLCELPGEALLETRVARDGSDLVVAVDLARPLGAAAEADP